MQLSAKTSCNRLYLAISIALISGSMISGCAGNSAFRDGKALIVEGRPAAALEKLEEAVRLEPRNAEYKLALSNYKTSLERQYMAEADLARKQGRQTEAEKAYRLALQLNPTSDAAVQGIEAIARERKHKQVADEIQALLKRGDPIALDEAAGKLRQILLENPEQKDALSLRVRLAEINAKQVTVENKLNSAYRKPISLEFKEAPLKAIFEVISKVSGLNFFYDKDLRPDLKASLSAKNTSVEDAIRILLLTNQLEQRVVNENSLLIYPNTPQKLKDYQALSIRTFYLANADVKAVSNTLKTILKAKDLVIDERLGVIVMRDTPDAIKTAEKLVALQDLSDPEVMLEVEILEIKRSRLMELGIQFPSQLSLAPIPNSGDLLTWAQLKQLRGNNIKTGLGSTLVNARREDQDADILANPRIRVKNKEKAKIQIGDRVPVITTTSTATGFVSESVSYVDVGLKLEVEPNISLDEEVGIKVNLEVSNLVREVLSKSGSLSYQIGQRAATTNLRLKDGETQVLAGLISNEDRSTGNKLPGLGDLPIAGRLFGSTKDDAQRSEILLSITPRILRAVKRPDFVFAEFESGTETSVGAPSPRVAAGAEAAAPSPQQGGRASSAVPADRTDAVQGGDVTGAQRPLQAAGNDGLVSSASYQWAGPSSVKLGEQFSIVLKASSDKPVFGVSALLSVDPQYFQLVSAHEGDFFRQLGGTSQFSQRLDASQGKAFFTALRNSGAGVNGSASLVTLVLKAVKVGVNASIAALSLNTEPPSAGVNKLPPVHFVKIE